MNALDLQILYTYSSSGAGIDCHAHLYLDASVAQAAGQAWQAQQAAQAKGFGQQFTFMVLPLEGPLA